MVSTEQRTKLRLHGGSLSGGRTLYRIRCFRVEPRKSPELRPSVESLSRFKSPDPVGAPNRDSLRFVSKLGDVFCLCSPPTTHRAHSFLFDVKSELDLSPPRTRSCLPQTAHNRSWKWDKRTTIPQIRVLKLWYMYHRWYLKRPLVVYQITRCNICSASKLFKFMEIWAGYSKNKFCFFNKVF